MTTLPAQELPRSFASRAAMADWLRREFPAQAQPGEALAPLAGGRAAAEPLLLRLDPTAYRRTRNALDGAVTRLSAHVRHGVVSLAELRDLALARANRPEAAEKFISELAWRDYWQRVYAALGERVWEDQEPYKTGYAAADYAAELPAALPQGGTGLACMDAFARELAADGYLHNHARMWVAAYVVHVLRVRWQAGARWFLRHLLDGDPASNNLSWQWVASTFSHKPYYFNRANLERYTGGRHCAGCPAARSCPFAGGYPELARRWFPNLPPGSLER